MKEYSKSTAMRLMFKTFSIFDYHLCLLAQKAATTSVLACTMSYKLLIISLAISSQSTRPLCAFTMHAHRYACLPAQMHACLINR